MNKHTVIKTQGTRKEQKKIPAVYTGKSVKFVILKIRNNHLNNFTS